MLIASITESRSALSAVSTPSHGPSSLMPACTPTQQEIFGGQDAASAAAFALLLATHSEQSRRTHWLWVQDRQSIRTTGRPFLHGLPATLQTGLIHIAARTAEDALFALEEGVRCADFAFVIGEIAGDPKALDFTASRRLSVASERHGVPLFLIRNGGHADLSAARRRWRVTAAPSHPNPWNARAPGAARWQADLFRARNLPPALYHVDDANGWQRHAGTSAPYPVDLAAAAGA
jgi:protein ImuA